MSEKPKYICSFCGANEDQVKSLVASDDGKCFICNNCLVDVNTAMGEEITGISFTAQEISKALSSAKEIAEKTGVAITPKSIKEHLDLYVISQDTAKKTIANAVYAHYKRLEQPVLNGVEISKSNILLIGPTGSGKTLIGQSVARMLDVPFIIANATSMTQAGYVGDDVETMLQSLIMAADGDIEKASRGIILIDEVDKIAKKTAGTSVSRDVSGEGVQQALLKLIEGTIAKVPHSGGRKHPGQSTVDLDTKDILFICAGAFVGLEDISKERGMNQTIGFFASPSEEDEANEKKKRLLKQKVSSEDLVDFGFIPEFVGRLPVISTLEKLTASDLMKVIKEPKNSILQQYTEIFKREGAELVITEHALEQIVELALEENTGARGLRSILENLLQDTMFDLPSSGWKKVEIDDIYGEIKIS